jgi:DNA end-binding protein Ku
MEEAGTHMADITEFVPLESVDPVYFDKAYYLAPDKGGAKPYALLARRCASPKRCAIGRWAARGKQYIVMIRAVEDGLVMQQLMYAGEVRSMKEIDIRAHRGEGRGAQARQAADRRADPPRPSIPRSTPTRCRAHRGGRREEGRGPGDHDAGRAGDGAQVIDLMEALRASLERKPPKKGASAPKADDARKPAKRAAAQAAPVAKKKVKSA